MPWRRKGKEMGNAYKCDRCGSLEEGHPNGLLAELNVALQNPPGVYMELNFWLPKERTICPTCKKAIIRAIGESAPTLY